MQLIPSKELGHFYGSKTARINIVGQAPGIRAQNQGCIGMTRVVIIYGNGLALTVKFSMNPDFCGGTYGFLFSGKGKSGDSSTKGFADKWHKRALDLAPNIELHILVGSYAQRYYLQQNHLQS